MNAYSTKTTAVSVIIVGVRWNSLEWKDRMACPKARKKKRGFGRQIDHTVHLMVHHLSKINDGGTDHPCGSSPSRVCLPAWCVCDVVARVKFETIAKKGVCMDDWNDCRNRDCAEWIAEKLLW